ncbi:uncharacterized protein LOC143431356 [Xylocopa sonorina]|uniref:uncharacterized protein LOC143431356 n=1 Tax=Xylocopa sonorina TaxID=1818115 RepID=UPI00403B06FC
MSLWSIFDDFLEVAATIFDDFLEAAATIFDDFLEAAATISDDFYPIYSSHRSMINLYYTLCEKDYDGIFEDFPQVGLVSLSICKILNIHSNQLRFKKLFELIMKERQLLKSKEELLTLDKMSKRGKKLANLYAKTLVTFLMIFLSLPLYNPLMDVISPLNETRPRQHIYRINYVLFDEFEYFYMVYLHLTWNAVIMIFIIIVIDLLYINVIYHACGLFAVCGYRIMKTTENCAAQEFEAVTNEERHEDFKGCVSLHHETLRYYNLLNNTCRNLYLIQMGLNIVLISITAVKVVMYLHQADQAIRAAVFLAGQQFHLYIISLPGQLLLDQSLELSDTM